MVNYTDPKEWGPHFWYTMRCVAHNYPVNNPSSSQKIDTRRFFEIIGDILPCEKCVIHYKEACRNSPLGSALCCRSCLVKWVESIYNNISVKTKGNNFEKKKSANNLPSHFNTHPNNIPRSMPKQSSMAQHLTKQMYVPTLTLSSVIPDYANRLLPPKDCGCNKK
jgi:hypothetical protein